MNHQTFFPLDRPVDLYATLHDVNGARIAMLPGDDNFTWEVDNEDIASIVEDAEDDSHAILILTSAFIEVTLTITWTPCPDIKHSFVLPTMTDPGGSRVVVFDSTSGSPIAGAQVYLNDENFATSAEGVAVFNSNCWTQDGCDLHVFPESHNYLSDIGVKVNDILVPLEPIQALDRSAGVRGTQDPSMIPEMLKDLMRIGFSGTAWSRLTEKSPNAILAPLIKSHLVLGTSIDEVLPLPAGVELFTQGYNLNEDRDGYYAQGQTGDSTLWGLGGYGNLITGRHTPSLLADDPNLGAALKKLFGDLKVFYHGNLPLLDLPSIPHAIDSNDLDMDEQTDDLIQDFNNYRDMGEQLIIEQALSQTCEISYGVLPAFTSPEADLDCLSTVLNIMGAAQNSVGFVPLGFGMAFDEIDPEIDLDCQVGSSGDEPYTLHFAPQHGGITGYDYRLLSIALPLTLFDGIQVSPIYDYSAVLASSQVSPVSLQMPEFLPLIQDFSIQSSSRGGFDIHCPDVDGASLYRAVFHLDDESEQTRRRWQIYWAKSGDFVFTPPEEIDLSWIADTHPGDFVQAMRLESSVGYHDLMAFNGTNINDMDLFTEAWSTHQVTKVNPIGCGNCSLPGTTGAAIVFPLLLLFYLRRRRN